MELLVATGNAGKVREIFDLLKDLPISPRELADFAEIEEVEETGKTFTDNAVLKARYYACHLNLTALADDSGLEVDALDGAPGVYSARYAGKNATNDEKIDKLLRELAATNDKQRRARFVCVMALANAGGEILFTAKGICEGVIRGMPRGANGFGYDPVFVPDGYSQTFGELSGKIKREISHRARAISKIIEFLADFIAV